MSAPSRPDWTSQAIRPLLLAAIFAAALGVLLARSAGFVPALSPAAAPAAVDDSVLAAAFVPNRGQSDAAVRFELRATGGTLFLTNDEVVLARQGTTIRLRFADARRNPEITGVDRLPGVVNYFRGDRTRWRTKLPTYAAIRYGGLYPGIDVRYDRRSWSGTPWTKATYTVAPGADPSRIRWRYEGAASLTLDAATGALRIGTRGNRLATIVEPAPTASQEIDERTRSVAVRYRIGADRTVRFEVGRYDRSRPLLIGPTDVREVLAPTATPAYSTHLGGFTWDEAFDVKVDASANAYVAGYTFSRDFPVANSAQPNFGGTAANEGVVDAFVTKLSPDGRTLLFSTFLGGTKVDVAQGIALDATGNAYVAGRTESTNFPTTAGVFQRSLRGFECQRARKQAPQVPCHDAFVTKLSPTGGIVYSTLFGGSLNEEALGIAVDGGGNAYITGNTESLDLPTRAPFQASYAGPPCPLQVPCPSDAFVTKLNATGSGLVYSTYLGGKQSERAAGIAVDGAGSAYVTGTTRSTDFPTRNARQADLGGAGNECGPPPVDCPDAYVTKLSATGSTAVYSTYLGGSRPETGGAIAVDAAANAYVTGNTRSADFPTANAVQATIDNSACNPPGVGPELCDDVFVTKFNPTGGAFVYSTFLRGRADDQGLGIAADDAGNAYVTGSTSSRNFVIVDRPAPAFGGYIDAFVTKLAPDGLAVVFSTVIGGSKTERGNAVAVDGTGDIFVTGSTSSSDFPATRTSFQPASAGDIDAFVVKIKP